MENEHHGGIWLRHTHQLHCFYHAVIALLGITDTNLPLHKAEIPQNVFYAKQIFQFLLKS